MDPDTEISDQAENQKSFQAEAEIEPCRECGSEILVQKGTVRVCLGCGAEFR